VTGEMHLYAKIELNSEMQFEAKIELVWRCIWTMRLRNSVTYLKALMARVWRGNWRPRSSNSEIHLEENIMLNSEINLDVVIERVWRLCNSERQLEAEINQARRCTWRPKS
jgi:hypothetical protein